ncbi:MAG: DUF2024 family protein [Dyadobacter fermentans]
MKIAVWDTYVTKKDGALMHFDILVPEELGERAQIYQYGKEYLSSKGQEGQALASEECRFCHIEQATPEITSAIEEKGYFIIEMQGCK